MRAVVYNGPRDVRVANVPDAKIERPTDVLVKISRTNICGSDLHMYEGRTDVEPGKVARVTFTPDKAGDFTYLCDIFCGSGHENVHGILTVTD